MLHLHQGLELLEQGLIVCLLVLLGVLHEMRERGRHERGSERSGGFDDK